MTDSIHIIPGQKNPLQKRFILKLITLLVFVLILQGVKAQGFLHAEGTRIVNGQGEPVLLRGIGTGNWMIMEGYMMKTEGVAGTQHEIENRLVQLIGEQKTTDFFNYWLDNHFTRADVDSMKAWGFNSVRVNMHYKWFTLPVEEEPIPGNQTWVLKGFKLIDNLLDWCAQNEMYLILDLHAAPGGQGKNADISDYDPSKPSLWESEANKIKTVALWRKLAERYQNSQWMGGYDLINETNWTFSEPDNQPLRSLFGRITTAIREVDKNHILFIEGNSYANDFGGLTPPWDNNLVYSFHRYWSSTSYDDLDFVKYLRDQYNVPLWMGESGENSNTWFTEFISTCEENNIGWSWWPVKKNGVNNPLNVAVNQSYLDLVRYWRGEISTPPSAAVATSAVMQWAKNHRIENCRIQRNVIDAMIRQPHTDEVLPFKSRTLADTIYFTDYDLGKNGFAYSDKDVGNYGGEWTGWNNGWELRNDGVDIEKCSDKTAPTNGYSVGWAEPGEWMQFSSEADSTAIYSLNVRHASGGSGSKFHIEANGAKITASLSLPSTGGWQTWKTNSFENIVLPAGKLRIRFVIEGGSSNLSFFGFNDPKSAKQIDFNVVSAKTSPKISNVWVVLNKDITTAGIQSGDFQLKLNGITDELLSVTKDSTNSNTLIFQPSQALHSDQTITLSYNGTSVKWGEQNLTHFENYPVQNLLPVSQVIPGKIQAEDFEVNKGLKLEACSDVSGGWNTAYATNGDYLDYRVHVTRTGYYALNYRVAALYNDAELIFQIGDGENFTPVDTVKFSTTGGWQNWQTQTRSVRLEEGYYFIRLLIHQGEHNLNWFEFDLTTSAGTIGTESQLLLYPNPASNHVRIVLPDGDNAEYWVQLISLQGILVRTEHFQHNPAPEIDLQNLPTGHYLLRLTNRDNVYLKQLIINK